MENEVVSKNFIEIEIDKDLAEGVYDTVHTRFFLAAGQVKGGLVQNLLFQSHKTSCLTHPAVNLALVQPHVFGAEGDRPAGAVGGLLRGPAGRPAGQVPL